MENCLKSIKRIKKEVIKICPHCDIEITEKNFVKFIRLKSDGEIKEECLQCINCDGFFTDDSK